ncbi:hypothetical protein MEA186_18205 [Mesorhizobium amorphae CCNWGS0123]|uniref:Uncharacterized protein n=1 Tax=Mesorhizobium amorphae CCNWGS0123 TaxID=1082933 RepID=G6YCJ1_9HYPH|nr:hypothetical protein MEA186_18205 [Mesorhizobium amorphae CCNWGS0123]
MGALSLATCIVAPLEPGFASGQAIDDGLALQKMVDFVGASLTAQ